MSVAYRYLYRQAVPSNGALLDMADHEATLYRSVVEGSVLATDPVEASGKLWVLHNSDDRPFGQSIRSMCVLDVVALVRADTGEADVRMVSSFGFTPVRDTALRDALADRELSIVICSGTAAAGSLFQDQDSERFFASYLNARLLVGP